MSKTVAIIVAAGAGERMSGDTPKQLAALAGRPMVAWSVLRLSQVCDEVVVVAPPDRGDEMRTALAEFDKVRAVVAGGATRQESVFNGLEALPEGASRVLVHDAARPCVSSELVRRVVDALYDNDAVVPVVPAVDTLVRERDGSVDAILDRVHVSMVQTPQGFAADLVLRAHREARGSGLQSSDDGSLVLALGVEVATVAGERTNVKVTYPEDVAVAEAILRLHNEDER
jgi:2-C-methyl-D-erythritol 4-phosphate cytidylyltransferase